MTMSLSAAKTWRFRPGLKDGEPVRYRQVIAFSRTDGARWFSDSTPPGAGRCHWSESSRAGLAGSAPASKENSAWAIQITSPLGRTGVVTNVRIVAQIVGLAHADQPVRAWFYVDGKLVGEVTAPPYSVEWVDDNPLRAARDCGAGAGCLGAQRLGQSRSAGISRSRIRAK